MSKHNFKIGDIISTSWGYDQTNVDFYQVVGVTDKMVKMKEIESRVEQDNFMSGRTLPVKDKFANDEVITKKVKDYAGEFISFEFGIGRKWNGKSLRCSWYA